jgi:hypothetical protein
MTEIIPKRKYGGKIEPCGRIWPDGQFTLGYAAAAGLERLESAKELADKMTPLIGLSIDSNSHSQFSTVGDGSGLGRDDPSPGRGKNGITTHGRRLLSNAVSFLQRRHGRKRLSFVTLTVPDVTYEESWNLSSNWSQVLRVFFQKLGRAQEKKGIPPHYASCTEMQPNRCDREGHPSLHIHFVMVGKARGLKGWAFSPGMIRQMWRESLEKYLWSECTWDACENIQQVKRNAAAYLSKYVSKGVSGLTAPSSAETGWKLPHTWYNISLKLRQYILSLVLRSPEMMLLLESLVKINNDSEAFHYIGFGVIPDLNTPGPHFWYGRLSGEMLGELQEIWRAAQL